MNRNTEWAVSIVDLLLLFVLAQLSHLAFGIWQLHGGW